MNYFWLTVKHKYFVFKAGLRLQVPIYLLIMHDWTKFLPCELPHYQRQFFGAADNPLGFSYAWLHHQRCNKHHWEYWIPITGHNRGGYKDMQPLPMPEKYIREMVADWLGAARAYEGEWPGNSWPWWENNREKIFSHTHSKTASLIDTLIAQILGGVDEFKGYEKN